VIITSHEPVISVVALLPMLADRGLNNKLSAFRISHDPGHVRNLKFDSHHILILPKEKGDNAKAVGFRLFPAPVTY
jgi:hypothetical protein